jgi:chromosome segregation ATPase
MNSFGKVLVVFVTACSLGFVAFSLSLVTGGPNWKGESESAELTDDFIFTTTPGEKPTYSAKLRKTDQAVGSQSRVLAEVVVAARKKHVEDAKAEDARLAGEIARLTPLIKDVKDLIPPDEAAMKARMERLDKTLTMISDEIQKVTQEIAAKALAIQAIQKTAQERRDEGYRLKNQLELMRNDMFVAQAQQRILEDELVRVEENLKRLERRNEQLKKQVEPYEK